jgi:putative heme iron utilization protein
VPTASAIDAETAITPLGVELGGAPPADFDPVAMARELLRTARTATLATLDPGTGWPFASLTNVATDTDGSIVFLASGLALHTRNMEADGRVSLLLTSFSGKGDPMANTRRLTVSGDAARTDAPSARRRFLARHPKAKLYAGFADFAFYRVVARSYHPNGGFAQAGQIRVEDLACDLSDAAELVAAEEGAVEHMNEDHADAVRQIAVGIAGREDGLWRVTGIDPLGMDIDLGSETARVTFPERVTTSKALRRVLIALTAEARARD